jgi:hypothetical protein
MNIFYLDRDARQAAEAHSDKLLLRQIVSCAQLLSTSHRVLDGIYNDGKWILPDEREQILYKATNISHPCSVWVWSNLDHYRWIYDLLYFLIGEYRFRWNQPHRCEKLQFSLLDAPHNIPVDDWQEPPLAIPADCQIDNAVESYRLYFTKYNHRVAMWTRREQPSWWNETVQRIHS